MSGPDTSHPLVRIADVRRVYPQGDLEIEILKGVSLDIAQGES